MVRHHGAIEGRSPWWTIRAAQNRKPATYRCPFCGRYLPALSEHVLVMPDGRKHLWEPHGVLGECIRSTDNQRQSWLDFLNTSPGARQAWCEQRNYSLVQSNAALRAFVEQIDSLLTDPCK